MFAELLAVEACSELRCLSGIGHKRQSDVAESVGSNPCSVRSIVLIVVLGSLLGVVGVSLEAVGIGDMVYRERHVHILRLSVLELAFYCQAHISEPVVARTQSGVVLKQQEC